MSEHEGFCAPLLEAFQFDLPVMAFDAGAVAETLGGAGILIQEKRFEEIAEMAHLLVHDEQLRARVVARQREVLGGVAARDDEELLVGFVEQALRG